MRFLTRLQMVCHPGVIRFFLRSHRLLRSDPRYSPIRLLKAAWRVSRHDKIVKHEGRFVHSSFLPPLPSRAAEQVLFGAQAGGGTLFDGHINARRHAPISMYVAVTAACRYQCGHCSAARRNGSSSTEMSGTQLQQLLADLQQMGTAIIGLTGGEPLRRSDLSEIIEGLDDRSVCMLFTSGDGMTAERAVELKAAGLFAVGVSLDSSNASEMDRRRGTGGAFAQAVKAVKHCRDAGLYTMTQTVASPGALDSGRLKAIVALSYELGAHEVRVLENMPAGRFANIDSSKILTEREREDLKWFHIRMNKSAKAPKVSVFAHTEDHENYGCGAGTQHSYIDAAGNLYPCDFVPVSFGNALKDPIAELWESMHARIGVPRESCMIMEMYAANILAGRTEYPVRPENASECLGRLKREQRLPGFYRTLAGDR